MSAVSDYLNTGAPSTPTAWQIMQQVPQYRVNETAPNVRQDAAITNTRTTQDFAQRTLPDLQNAAAAAGNLGSSGAQNRVFRAGVDANRNIFDTNRMLYRNLASIAQQKIMATVGGMA
jgi:hypothetical protein